MPILGRVGTGQRKPPSSSGNRVRNFPPVAGYLAVLSLLTACSTPSPDRVAARSLPSVVTVISHREEGPPVMGTGFFTGQFVVTNLHVVEGASRVEIKGIGAPASQLSRGWHARDRKNDLVLIGVERPDYGLLQLGPNEPPPVGESVYVLGTGFYSLSSDIARKRLIAAGVQSSEQIERRMLEDPQFEFVGPIFFAAWAQRK